MFRLLDARTGAYARVRSARPGLLRVCAQVPEAGGLTGVRVLLVADLLARAAELGSLQVLIALAYDGGLPGRVPAVERAAGALGIHPPAGPASSGDVQALLGGPVDVHVVSHGTSRDAGRGGLVSQVGDASIAGTETPADLLAGNDHDPLAVRLALMSFSPYQPADLTRSVLAGAHDTAGDWRRRVARWAEQPSRPIPAHLAETMRTAFADLDTPTVLTVLRSLADDDGVAPGAKFETFVYADRVLGLDLPRDIGKPA